MHVSKKHERHKIRLARGVTEDGVVVGNTTDKYQSSNPLVQRLMNGFTHALEALTKQAAPTDIHEVGCGEGYWSIRFAQKGYPVRGSDFSRQVVALAEQNSAAAGLSIAFSARSIYDLSPPADAANLIICCEVFEHLEHPERALEVLSMIATPYLLVSVPREPVWRILNIARGKYWGELGNTPGHLQHWSKRSFLRFLSQRFDVIATRSPLPWTMALCHSRH